LSSLLVGACSDGAGALLVLDYAGDEAELGATEVEIVLADPELAARGVFLQRRNTIDVGPSSEEEVVYYREVTTTQRALLEGNPLDGFAIRLEVDPQLAMTKAIPFVLVYKPGIDGGGRTLVAAGRIGDGDPGELVVPKDVVHRFTVALERLAPPEVSGIAPGHGGLHQCEDRTITGAVFRFATTRQIRLAFLASSPYDLDCDMARVDEQVDCNDLSPKFFVNNEAPEACAAAEDYNCSGGIESQISCFDVRSIHTNEPISGCAGLRDCVDATCRPIDRTTEACRCGLGTCQTSGCRLLVVEPGATPSLCTPGVAELALCDSNNGPCRFKLFNAPITATVELSTLNAVAGFIWGTTVDVAPGDAVYVRVTPTVPVAAMQLGAFTLERVTNTLDFFTYTVALDNQVSNECRLDDHQQNVMECGSI